MWRNLSVICLFITYSESAKILGVFPTASISHQVVFRPLMKELAGRGHHLTVLTPDPVHYEKGNNITEIDVHDVSYELQKAHINLTDMKISFNQRGDVYTPFYEMLLILTEKQIMHPQMQELLNNNETFDLCFFESIVVTMFPLKDRFGCRMILISSLPGTFNNYESTGTPIDPTLYANTFHGYHEGDLSFFERLDAIYVYLSFKYIYHWKFVPLFDELSKRLFGDVRSVVDVEKDADMYFINAHSVLAGIRPVPPSIVYMGSMNVKPPKPLEKIYTKILDEAKNGAVYFSLGSNVRSIDLPIEVRESFVQAFEELPYTILMKWENDTLPSKPSNVHIFKWMPQQDILAHPNVKAFITHGGQQSLEEAIDRRVPLIAMPFIGDQVFNAKRIFKLGIGLQLNQDTINKKIVKQSVYEIINNPRYKEKIDSVHDIIKDEPQTPIERAVWWTEYVLRHKGAQHLKSPAVHVPFFKYYYLDIFALVLSFILTLIAFLVLTVIKIMYVFKRNSKIELNIKKHQ